MPAVRANSDSRSLGWWPHQLLWFASAVVGSFVVSFVGSDVLALHHDLYLGAYFVAVGLFAWRYLRFTDIDVRVLLRKRWLFSVIAGVGIAVPVVANVWNAPPTARPTGAYLAFELVWRGLIYGAVDAVLLTVLPCLIVYQLLGGRLATWPSRMAYVAASLAAVIVITAAYHLGYEQYRRAGVVGPEVGNTLLSVPMLLTVNPVGALLSHSVMHIAVVVHDYGTESRLPPRPRIGSATYPIGQTWRGSCTSARWPWLTTVRSWSCSRSDQCTGSPMSSG